MDKEIRFLYTKHCGIDIDQGARIAQALKPEIERVNTAIQQNDHTTEYAFLNVPRDAEQAKEVGALVEAKKRLAPTMLVVIGTGGSHLGAFALYQALYGTMYNDQRPDLKIYWVDTIDPDYIYDIVLCVQQELERGGRVLCNVISKSGTTLETITACDLFITLLKSAQPETYHNYVVVTTEQDSPLWQRAEQEGFARLSVPASVGGRYSVFTPVGLFPLGMLGVSLASLLAGAQQGVHWGARPNVLENMSALSAYILKEQYYRGCVIHDTFVFAHDLRAFGAWYRQLMAESIGKMYDRSGGLVRIGMMPTVSVGPPDLHSVGQLYAAGPHNRFTTFVSLASFNNSINNTVLSSPDDTQCALTLNALMRMLYRSTKAVYAHQELPFVVIDVPEKSAYYVGQLMQIKMLEMIYLGFLLDVNPFDQPQVELYKHEARKIMHDMCHE